MFEKGREQSNQGEIYQAHVTWEHIWKEGGCRCPEKYQGLYSVNRRSIK